ncbi:hypothetical protein [Acinetobacter larvae]|uniref:Uncharacterized protein n=1 Tax=Acinetobacter larvae TaxID=1789224 RepID=A0A1B2LX95_9GAMM|nr:hypothetical protein [Acinetobacter larvae]AOA57555.1 hypothetical protein BFG52_03760 [Acinetobacter larvae]
MHQSNSNSNCQQFDVKRSAIGILRQEPTAADFKPKQSKSGLVAASLFIIAIAFSFAVLKGCSDDAMCFKHIATSKVIDHEYIC